jgi:hypothetical protein
MERETGIEPATNSLEGCQSIENKQLLRPWRRILTIIFQQVSRPTLKIAIKVSNPRNDENWTGWRSHHALSLSLFQALQRRCQGESKWATTIPRNRE